MGIGMPECASNLCAGVDPVMDWINIIVLIAFVLTVGTMVYFVIRYRKRSDNDITSSVAHNTTIEVVWTVIPSLFFVVMFIFGIKGFYEMRSVPDNAMEIVVDGAQWTWTYSYPSDFAQGERKDVKLSMGGGKGTPLYLIDGQPTKLVMQSKDVLHSFFVPAFRVKEDVVPGMYTYISFTPTANGKDQAEYDIFCTEYCGKDHSYMIGKAVVMKREAFMQKMAELEVKASNDGASRGQEIYAAKCVSCHSLDGSRILGPSFKGLWNSKREFEGGVESVVADENYISESINNPNAKVVKGYPAAMTPQGLDDTQIRAVINYLKTL